MSKLYLAAGAEVMLTYNLWIGAGFHNGVKWKVVYFVYKHADGPRTNNGKEFLESVVMQLHSMAEGIENFLEGVTNTVTIVFVSSGWRIGTKYFICKKISPVLSWEFTIHKAQGKTLDVN